MGAVEFRGVVRGVEGVVDVDDLFDVRLHGEHILRGHDHPRRNCEISRQSRAHHRLGDGQAPSRSIDVGVIDTATWAGVDEIG